MNTIYVLTDYMSRVIAVYKYEADAVEAAKDDDRIIAYQLIDPKPNF